MVEVQNTPSNQLLIFRIFLAVLWFLAATYYFRSEIETQNNRIFSHTNNACVERVNVKKAALIKSCKTQVSSEDQKFCSAHIEGRLIELEQICPREIGALKSRYNTSESQLIPIAKAALSTILLWLVSFVFLRIFTKLSDHSDS